MPAAQQKKAESLCSAGTTGLQNLGGMKKEDRLKEAAQTYMKLGKIREFCEIHMQLKNYKKALAFAPGVSIEYWQELAVRHANILSQEGKEQAAIASIVCDKLDDAVGLFQMREEFEDGKLVRALHLTGGFSSVLSKIRSKDNLTPPATID